MSGRIRLAPFLAARRVSEGKRLLGLHGITDLQAEGAYRSSLAYASGYQRKEADIDRQLDHYNRGAAGLFGGCQP